MRPIGPDDLDAVAVVSDHPDVDVHDAVEHWAVHGWGPWLVTEPGGEPVGLLEVHYAGEGIGGIAPDEVELGWAIADERQGRGYATEAARAAIADAWEHTEARWLVAYIRPENTASHAVAAKLGLRRVADGTTRSGEPMAIYRLLRP